MIRFLALAGLFYSGAAFGYTPAAMPTNTALQSAATITYPGGLWRDTFGNGNGAPPLYYVPSNAACSLNAGAGDNGSQVRSADGKCWLATFPAQGADIRQWGADPTSTVDSTAAVNAAIATGLALLVPSGQFRITTLNSPLAGQSITGASLYNSQFLTTAATGDVLPINNPYVTINNIGIISTSGVRTGGCYIHIRSGYISITRYYLGNAYCAIQQDDGTTTNYIDQGEIINSLGSNQDVVIFGSGTGTGLVASYFGHTVMNSNTPTNNNIALYNVGDLLLDNIQSLSSTIDLKIAPGNGQTVVTVKCSNSYFDHGGTNMSVTPTGSGYFGRSNFGNCWFGDATVNGVFMNTDATGVIDGIGFNNCQFVNSAGTGLYMNGNVKNITVTGGSTVAGNIDGIYDNRASNYNTVIVTGNIIGPVSHFGPNETGYVYGGLGDFLTLVDNNMAGNTSHSFLSTNTAIHNVVENNGGYNPVGSSTPAVGASPWTYTNGPTPSTAYVYNGVISAMTIGGSFLFSSQCSPGAPCAIPLSPNETMVITYSTAPSVTVITE